MVKVPASGPIIHGFDISHYQPNFDEAMKKVQDPKFCILKAVEGLTSIDRSFVGHREAARRHGLLVGAYAFFHPSQPPIAQARHFVNVIGPQTNDDLPPVLDWETTDGQPAPTDILAALAWLNAVEAMTGKTPIIYTGPYFAMALNLNEHFARFPLWIAHYGTSAPLIPAPWKSWCMWQTGGRGVDLDVFNGTLEQMKMLAGGHSFVAAEPADAPAVLGVVKD